MGRINEHCNDPRTINSVPIGGHHYNLKLVYTGNMTRQALR